MNQPSSPESPLDGLLNVLRSAATAEELSGEATAVEAMASAIADSSRGTFVMKSTARARRVAALTAIGVLGFAGVAAAAKGAFVPDNRPSVHSTPESTHPGTLPSQAIAHRSDDATETTHADDEATETTQAAEIKAPETTTSTSGATTTSIVCADGNHGKTVSSVAQATPPGPGHGAAVSAAAQSDCGKKTDTTSVDTTTVTIAGDTTTTVADDEGKPADPGSQGLVHKPANPGSQGHGHSH